MTAKLSIFYENNKSLIFLILRWFFLIVTIILVILAIVFLSKNETLDDIITSTILFCSAIVSGAVSFALFSFRSGTLV